MPLPLKNIELSTLGESLPAARAALASMHRRMTQDPLLAKAYIEFMREYENMRHMTRLTSQEIQQTKDPVYYIPHHGIWQKNDKDKKLRVVFNASRPTTSGWSLNDIQHTGPKLQTDIAIVVTRWRMQRIAFCADIKMMYRQVRVLPKYTNLQRILWSPSPNEPAEHYSLQTVTYGENSSPWLALQTLRQLCQDEGKNLSEAVSIIEEETYIDDVLSGADDIDTARHRRNQLVTLLLAGGFILKK